MGITEDVVHWPVFQFPWICCFLQKQTCICFQILLTLQNHVHSLIWSCFGENPYANLLASVLFLTTSCFYVVTSLRPGETQPSYLGIWRCSLNGSHCLDKGTYGSEGSLENSSVGKGTFCQVWWPKFSRQSPHHFKERTNFWKWSFDFHMLASKCWEEDRGQ